MDGFVVRKSGDSKLGWDELWNFFKDFQTIGLEQGTLVESVGTWRSVELFYKGGLLGDNFDYFGELWLVSTL